MFESDDLRVHKGRRYGLYRAFVYDNKDPLHQGRLRLQIPSVYGLDDDTSEECVSEWAYPMFPVAGTGWGMVQIPPVKNPDGSNVMVWVAFEQGDIQCPVWMGCPVQDKSLQSDTYTNSKDKLNGVTGASVFSFSTPNGLKIILDDEHPEKAIVVQSKKCQMVFNDKRGVISVVGDMEVNSDVKTIPKGVSLNKHTHTGVHGETSSANP